MIVAASTTCIPSSPLPDIFDRLADLEYTNAEIVIGDQGSITPEEVVSQFDIIVHTSPHMARIFIPLKKSLPGSVKSMSDRLMTFCTASAYIL